MIYKNANIFTEDGTFVHGWFSVKEGLFEHIGQGFCEMEGIDLEGSKVIPGLIDVHGHGNSGYDFSTCDLEGLKVMTRYLAANGVTTVTPASMTMPIEALERAYANALALHKERDGARVAGINMEGPYFSYGKRGAQHPDYLKKPDFEEFKRLYDGCEGLIKIACVAPELEGAMDFIERAKELCTVSIAHTECTYDIAREAIAKGATQLTHLFNGMPSLHHRDPGPIAAGAEKKQVYAELICDGIHVHPSVIRMAFKMFPGRIILISDSLAGCGMGDGEYDLGGQKVFINGLRATLENGTIAGSVSNLFQMMRNAIKFGIPEKYAITAATINPAGQIGMDEQLGSIRVGKIADFVVCDDELNIKEVFVECNPIEES